MVNRDDLKWKRATHACGVFVDYCKIGRGRAKKMVDEKGYPLPRPGYEVRLEDCLVLVNSAGSFELRKQGSSIRLGLR